MKIRMICIMLFLLFAASTVSAEFYKYRDENGVLRFTDNLSEVPESQRKQVQSYQEIKSKPEPEKKTGTVQKEASPKDPLAAQAEKLRSEKKLLDDEFNQLEVERKQLLDDAKKERQTDEEAAYQKRIEDFNAKIKVYDEKRMKYEEEVTKFNAQLK